MSKQSKSIISEIEDLNNLVPAGKSIKLFEKQVGQFFKYKKTISIENKFLKNIKELILAEMINVEETSEIKITI